MIFLLLANHRSILGMHRAPNESTQPFMPRPGIPLGSESCKHLGILQPGFGQWLPGPVAGGEGRFSRGNHRPGEFQSYPIGASQFNSENIALTKKERYLQPPPPVAFIVMTNISWDTGARRYMEKLIHFTIKARVLKLH